MDNRQLVQQMFSAIDLKEEEFDKFPHIREEVKKSNDIAIFLNGMECTTATRASEEEGWVELMIVISIDDGLPSFAHEWGKPYKTIIYGNVSVLQISNRRTM